MIFLKAKWVLKKSNGSLARAAYIAENAMLLRTGT